MTRSSQVMLRVLMGIVLYCSRLTSVNRATCGRRDQHVTYAVLFAAEMTSVIRLSRRESLRSWPGRKATGSDVAADCRGPARSQP